MSEERSHELARRLREGLLICDGAMGTTLSAQGHSGGASLELMNAEQPDLVRAAHQAYLEAGADVLETNTFQGSRAVLERHGLGERTAELNAAGARLAREVAGDRAFVAGSIGPTGKILEPYGDYDPEVARAVFEEQAQALAEGGVDFFIVETFMSLEEIGIAIEAARATGLPVAASMAFDYAYPPTTPWGVPPKAAARELPAFGAIVVGANCGTISPQEMVEVLAAFRQATDLPLIAQPNAGRPQRSDGGAIYPEVPEVMADAAAGFLRLGATVIGGCCGTRPEHIKAVAQRLRAA